MEIKIDNISRYVEINGERIREEDRTCKECGCIKNGQWYKSNRYKKGGTWIYRCLKCSHRKSNKEYKEYKKEYWKLNGRTSNLKRRYNITEKTYQEIYNIQQGLCAICGKWFKKLHVDHNHLTGKIRGLLCNKCNVGLGVIEDSEYLQKAIEYLQK